MVKAAYLANLRNFELFSSALEREKLDDITDELAGFDPESFISAHAELREAE